jgi:hypothetical protein
MHIRQEFPVQGREFLKFNCAQCDSKFESRAKSNSPPSGGCVKLRQFETCACGCSIYCLVRKMKCVINQVAGARCCTLRLIKIDIDAVGENSKGREVKYVVSV